MALASLGVAVVAIVHAGILSAHDRKCDRLYRNYAHLATLESTISSAIVGLNLRPNAPVVAPGVDVIDNAINTIVHPAELFGFDASPIQRTVMTLFAYWVLPLEYAEAIPRDLTMVLYDYRDALVDLRSEVRTEANASIEMNRGQCGTLVVDG